MYKKALFCSKYINLDQPKPMQTLNFIVLDYDPFGMITVGRNWTAGSSYRYGFNGKEQDPETYGNGNIYDYGFRIFNPRLGRFLSVDPLSPKYPMLTPYQFASNCPIACIDIDGLEGGLATIPRSSPVISIPEIVIPKPPTMPLPPIMAQPDNGVITFPEPPVPPGIPTFRFEQTDWNNIDLADPTTWPTPPIESEFTVGEASKVKPKSRGEKSFYDKDGGEWRPHKPDKHHPLGHWDYKPGGNPNNGWQNITPDGIKIPEGKIYGRDFFGFPAVKIRVLYSKDQVTDDIKEFNKANKKALKQYDKEYKKYEKKLEKYKKEEAEWCEKYCL